MLVVRDLTRDGLAPASFTLDDGECIAVRGASGSGKTLLLRAIADLDPNEGVVTLDGAERMAMPAPEWRRKVTYIAAEPGWWTDTVEQHFTDWTAAAALVRELGLQDDCGNWPISRLSTGERQRLGLVRALMLRPQVLLLDESTSGLDDAAAAAVERVICARLRDGASAIWVTHDTAQARRLARRALAFDGGRMCEEAM
ncbi:MAG: ATP-binding cassette domain-containing protein [Alphaproteobacteria bacterium]|nr:ATP-binding cassette domain-containing protein [Alphaproteobacteria bacterium]